MFVHAQYPAVESKNQKNKKNKKRKKTPIIMPVSEPTDYPLSKEKGKNKRKIKDDKKQRQEREEQ